MSRGGVIWKLTLALSVAGLVTACDSTSPLSPEPAPAAGSLQEFVESVSVAGAAGVFRNGPAPPPSGGPAITVTGNQVVINGGTSEVVVAADTPFSTIYLFIGGRGAGLVAEGPGSVGGFYEVTLPSPQTQATLLLSFPQSLPAGEFECSFAVATPSDQVGPASGFGHVAIPVGTGDVQVTLSWNAPSDVDLHVVDPRGEEIYYGNPRSASGGQLDLDSNAACDIDGVNNENITWAAGTAPNGTYTVRVDYWSSCDVARTDYTVRIINGTQAQTFRGTFTGDGDNGGSGSGVLIGTFDRVAGLMQILGTPNPVHPSNLFGAPRRPVGTKTPAGGSR